MGFEDEIESPIILAPRSLRRFKFVNAIGASIPNSRSEPLIRSHVTKEANRQPYSPCTGQRVGPGLTGVLKRHKAPQRQMNKFRIDPDGLHPLKLSIWKKKKKDCASRGPSPERVDDESNKSHNLEIPLAETELRPSAVYMSTVGGGRVDPFDSLPVPMSPRMEFLSLHYRASNPLMKAVRSLWLTLATQDEAFFFIYLCHAARNLALMEKRGDPAESLLFKNEAIGIINKRLHASSSNISEGTLGTVASILSYESVNGTPESIQMHMNGLQQMIKVRGGIKQDNCGPTLRRLLAWADIQSASVLSTVPKLPPIEVASEESLRDKTCYSTNVRRFFSQPSILKPTQQHSPYSQVVDESVSNQLRRLCQLSSLSNLNEDGAKYTSSQIWTSDAIYSVQREFMLLANAFKHTSVINQSCCIAGLIYIEAFLRHVRPTNSKMLDILNSRLQRSITKLQTEPECTLKERSYLLAWTLFIGALSSTNADWYLLQLAPLIRSLNIISWDDMRIILNGIAFPAIVPMAARFWKRISGYE